MSRLGEVPLTQTPNMSFYEEPGEYVMDVSLTSGQEKTRQITQIDNDSDFIWLATVGSSTGVYKLKLQISGRSGRYMSSSYVNNVNYVGSANFPVPLLHEVYFSAGSSISGDFLDTSGGANTIQLLFKGIKRFKTGQMAA